MSYLTWREYVRTGPVCLGALLVIAGAVIALLPGMGYVFVEDYQVIIGAVVAIVGLIFILVGFFFTSKKRDSVTRPVDTRQDDTPPPPPPPS